MENASQALLIAGGVLLGIITITLLITMFSTISTMGNANTAKADAERLAAWNSEWEAYNKRLLYGTEVLTVINKAEENNKEYADNETYQVIIKGLNEGGHDMELEDFKVFVRKHKTSIFSCEEVLYSDVGRVHNMVFKFVE